MSIFIRKKYLNQLYQSLETEKLILLYGARQVGKTTLLKMLLESSDIKQEKYYINFEDIFDMNFKSKDEFIDYLSFKYKVDFASPGILMLDEVQYFDNIEKLLKSLYDDDSIKINIIATWSGLWQLNEFGSSLVGRKKEIFVYPLDFYEFLELKWVDLKFLSLDRWSNTFYQEIEIYLKEFYTYGWYPEVALASSEDAKIQELWKIITTYIDKDVNYWLEWEDMVNFKKFLDYLIYNIWDLLKMDKIATILGLSIPKIEKYTRVFESSFMLYKVFPYYKNSRREYTKQPQIFFNDLWVVNFLKNNFNFDRFDGKVVENFVFLELQKNKNMIYDNIKFYKKINGSEIDLIYQYKKGWIVPIEIKMNDKNNIPKIFSWFEKDYGDETKFFVRTTSSIVRKRKMGEKGILFLPFWMIAKSI